MGEHAPMTELIIDVPGLPVPWNKKISDCVIAESYRRTKSVWKTGDEVGLCGQSVHARLKRMGLSNPVPTITDSERAIIREYYLMTSPVDFDLDVFSASLGRPKTTISREARRMGLTDYNRAKSAKALANGKIAGRGKWSRQPHPRGMLGKKQSAKTAAAVSKASKLRWATWKTFGIGNMAPEYREKENLRLAKLRQSLLPHQTYTRAKGGRRKDLGTTHFRSSWEANYARYLNLLLKMKAIVRWEYEPETFWFEGIKRGVLSYKPDFRLTHQNGDIEYIELKGWVTAKDRTKWKRMAKYHPQIRLTVVKAKGYRAIARKWSSSIPNWETDRRDLYR